MGGICKVDGCGRKLFSRGLCASHYHRQRKGIPLSEPIQEQHHGVSLEERLKRRVSIDQETQCWNWTGSLNNGYGQIRMENGKPALTHRVSYSLFVSPDIAGMTICHRCDNPLCINPDHLFAGTQADNVADMHTKGRAKKRGLKGAQNNNAKLTEEVVRLIRGSDLRPSELARKLGISHVTVSDIRSRKSWAHIT